MIKRGKGKGKGMSKKAVVKKLKNASKNAVSKKPGKIKGGEKGRDKIPALLNKGEFVVNAKASKHYRQLLEMINSPKMFGGGDLDNDGDWGDWGGDDGESDSDDGSSDEDYGNSADDARQDIEDVFTAYDEATTEALTCTCRESG